MNWELLFLSIHDAYENKKESVKQAIIKETKKIKLCFSHWSKIIENFRASQILTRSERLDLARKIDLFEKSW